MSLETGGAILDASNDFVLLGLGRIFRLGEICGPGIPITFIKISGVNITDDL
jgi:hypothetical protein